MEIFEMACELIIPILVFGVLFAVGKIIHNRLINSNSRILNPREYFPEQELETLKQVYYLVMMLIFFVFILYILIFDGNDYIPIAVLQILISVYVALTLDYGSWNNKIMFFLLVPYESIVWLVLNVELMIWPIFFIFKMQEYHNFCKLWMNCTIGCTVFFN